MVLIWNAAIVGAAFFATFLISTSACLARNFLANLKSLRAYKFDE